MPKVSIVVPVYNTEKYIAQTLDSVLNQTFSDFECICINDGSTDNSLKILKEYAEKDKRIRIISQENAGLANVKNVGIRNAVGDYIIFVDSDDFISLDYVEKMYARIIEKDYDIVYCRHKLYYSFDNTYESNKTEKYLPELAKRINSSTDKNFIMKNLLFLVENARSSCMKIYKLSTIKNNNVMFFDHIRAQGDYVHNVLFAMYSLNNLAFVDEELYFYRKQVESITADRDKMVINGIRSFISLTKSLKERNFIGDNKIMLSFALNGYIKRLGKKFSKEKQKLIFAEIKEHFYYLKENIFKTFSFNKAVLNFYLLIIKLLGNNSFVFFRIIKNFYK